MERRSTMDGRGLETPPKVAGSGRGDDTLLRTLSDEMSHIATERTAGVVDAQSGSAFCADAYYISNSRLGNADVQALPPALPTPDEESVAIFSCLSAFVSGPPSGYEDDPTTVRGLYRHTDDGGTSHLGRNDKANQGTQTSGDISGSESPQKLRAVKDNIRLDNSEGETSKTATFHTPGNSKQLVSEIKQLLYQNASSSKLPVAVQDRPSASQSAVCQTQPSSQCEYTREGSLSKQRVLGQQSSKPSTVESQQRCDGRGRLEASQVSEVLPPQLHSLPQCPLPFEGELHGRMIADGGLTKPADLQSNSEFRKQISPKPVFPDPMPRDRELLMQKPWNSNPQKPDFTGTEVPPESIVPAEFLNTNYPSPEVAFIGAVQSQAANNKLLSSEKTMRDTSLSALQVLTSLQDDVHPIAKEKCTTEYGVSVSQVFLFDERSLTRINIDEKTSGTIRISTQSQAAPSFTETNREAMKHAYNAVESPEKLALNYTTFDLIPPPVEFLTVERTPTNADDQSITCKGDLDSIEGVTDNDRFCPTNDPLSSVTKDTDRTASLTGDSSNAFKGSNISRSLMRPKLPPPEPPPPTRLLDHPVISSPKGAVGSATFTAAREIVARKVRNNNDTVDRISLCQYGRDTALASLKAETVTIRVKASSTANLVEAVGLSPRFSARPEPPRRSCSIPRKPSTHSLSECVRVDPDGSAADDLQKQSPELRIRGGKSTSASTMRLRNGSFLRSSTTIKAFGGDPTAGSDSEGGAKPTAQIRPNAIRSISSSVCTGTKSFPNVESLIQQYSQSDASAATTTTAAGESRTLGKGTSKYGSKSSGGSTSKFGTLKGRLRDYVTASSTKKQAFSYSVGSKTLSHARDKNGSKLIKPPPTGTWEPKPTDYQRDEEEAPPENISETKPNYISSYLSFAGPKPYTPPRTVSSLVTTNEDQPTVASFKTFIGSRIESCSSLASDKDSLAKFRTEASSQSLTGSPSSSGSPPDSKIDMINEWLESRSVDCNSPSCDSENQSPTKLESFKTDSFDSNKQFFREKESSAAVFTREPPSKLSTFRTSGSINVNTNFVSDGDSNKLSSPGSSRRPLFPGGVATSRGITHTPCGTKITDHSKTLPRNLHARSRNLSESEVGTVRSSVLFNPSTLGKKLLKESDKVCVESRPNGVKELPAESVFENADCIVTSLIQKLRSTFSEETDRAEDVETSKERLVSLTRQFVADSQNLVSSATQNRDRLIQSVTTSSETLSRIVDHCLGTASAMGPTSQAVILNNRVMDLTGAYRATMVAARVAVGKPLNCPEMKALMKQATSLAAILSSLIKLLNRL